MVWDLPADSPAKPQSSARSGAAFARLLLFLKVPSLRALAPTQAELPFIVTQLIALGFFTTIATRGVILFRVEPIPPLATVRSKRRACGRKSLTLPAFIFGSTSARTLKDLGYWATMPAPFGRVTGPLCGS